VTTTDSAQVTPTTAGHVAVQPAERVLAPSRAAVRAERRAWLILCLAFVTFCVLLFSAAKFVVDFVNTAEVDQSARVLASRGVVVVVSPGSAEQALLGSRTELGVGTVLSIDRTSASASSAELQLFDKSRMKILAGASVALTRMEVGRFINQQWLALDQYSGPIQYQTVVPIEVRVPNGVVHLGGNGDYTVWIDGDVSRVLVYAGEARVASGGAPVVVPEGRRGEIDRLGGIRVDRRDVALVPNGSFANRAEGWQPHDVPNSALDVNGARFWVSGPDELGSSATALRVVRETRKREHGETGLIQKLARDVSGFRHVYLRAWVRVDYAELSGGGQFGSEYPMMLRVVYEGPSETSDYPWAVGFYYANPENRDVPASIGVLWPQGEWKRYEVDLKQQQDEANVPYFLSELTVMGQGHSYDARIAGIELIGD
jgi:hypothetical protein